MKAQRLLALASTAGAALVALTIPSANAVPPAGGTCAGQWEENGSLVNPDDLGFFDTIDKNGDGIICIKDWTGPDPDPEVGFLAIDNMVRHRQ